MKAYELNAQLAGILGLPSHTRKAVLVLEAGTIPLLHLEVFAHSGRQIGLVAKPEKPVRFTVRLEPDAPIPPEHFPVLTDAVDVR